MELVNFSILTIKMLTMSRISFLLPKAEAEV